MIGKKMKKLLFLMLILNFTVTGCVTSTTNLVRTKNSGDWSAVKYNDDKTVEAEKVIHSSALLLRGNNKYGVASLDIVEIDGKFHISYFPGLPRPTQNWLKPNQNITVFAKFGSTDLLYQYNFMTDSTSGARLFYTGGDPRGLLKTLEDEFFVKLSIWNPEENKYIFHEFGINGSPHIVVRQKQ
jgi:hypothetical protein